MKVKNFLIALLLCFCLSFNLSSQQNISFDRYHNYQEVVSYLKSTAKAHPDITKLLSIGKSYSDKEIYVLQISSNKPISPDKKQAIFMGANLEGLHHIGSEQSLYIIKHLIEGYKKDEKITALINSRTLYIAPLLNPDAAEYFFKIPLVERCWNIMPNDDDRDMAMDEDPAEDINGDGFITMMRVKDPEGEWIPHPSEPRLMKKADPVNGEKGIYKLCTEGKDNDGDGEINEDEIGGVALNHNFPHAWVHFKKGYGDWPISEPETKALLDFFIIHRNIGLTIAFSTENNLLNLKTPGEAKLAAEKFKIPKYIAEMFGVDPEREFTMKEIMEFVKTLPIPAGIEITESMVAMILGLGPAMNIDKEDMKYYQEIQRQYKDMLKEAKIDDPDRQAKPIGEGDFIGWAYFQYGVPAFTFDLWAVPKEKEKEKEEGLTIDKLKKMSSEEFLKLEPSEIARFLKSVGAPPNVTPDMVIGMVKSGQVTPAKMAEFISQRPPEAKKSEAEAEEAYILKWIDKELGGKGFIPWTSFNHPTVGEVEIGGFKPYVKINPPAEKMQPILNAYSNFILRLCDNLPQIEITDIKVEEKGKDLYKVTAYVRNNGYFPAALKQGERAMAVSPIFLKLESKGQQLLAGKALNRIRTLKGSGGWKKFEWLLKGKKGSSITLVAESQKSGFQKEIVVLK